MLCSFFPMSISAFSKMSSLKRSVQGLPVEPSAFLLGLLGALVGCDVMLVCIAAVAGPWVVWLAVIRWPGWLVGGWLLEVGLGVGPGVPWEGRVGQRP